MSNSGWMKVRTVSNTQELLRRARSPLSAYRHQSAQRLALVHLGRDLYRRKREKFWRTR